jgi:hypothetical protein
MDRAGNPQPQTQGNSLMQVDYSRLPFHMQDGARLYVERGIPGGSFMDAVLSNNLVRAYAKADATNTAAMRDWAMWLYNDAPSGCHGSPEKVADWIKSGGLKGLERQAEAAE